MAGILDEALADEQVIKVLLNQIRILKGNTMSKILKDADGNLYRVEHYEQVTTDELEAEASKYDTKAKELREFLSNTAPAIEAPVATPEVPAPEVQPVAPTPEPIFTAASPEADQPAVADTPDLAQPAPIVL